MDMLYVAAVFLHIVAAAIWVGGMLFFAIVLVPVVRLPQYRAAAADLVHRTGMRFRYLGWSAIGVIVVTGAYAAAYRGVGLAELSSASFWANGFGRTFGIKLAVFFVMVVVSLLHDLSMGKEATKLLRAEPMSPKAARVRDNARRAGRLNLVLALAIVVLAVMMVRGSYL